MVSTTLDRNHSTAGFEAYWKLPSGFLSGNRHAGIVMRPGTGTSLQRLILGEGSIFCSGDWPIQPPGLLPVMDLRDAKSGAVVASLGKTLAGDLYCPFDLQSVVEAFQLELYTQSKPSTVGLQFARRLYYLLRPWIPRPFQIGFRKLVAPWQGKSDFPVWPLDISLDSFYHSLLQLMLEVSNLAQVPFVWFWPDGYTGAVVLTHDVETQAGHDTLWPIVHLEKKYGVRSLWNFVPERYQVDPKVLADLVADGFEIGVHGLCHDGHLFDSYQLFLNRASRINDYLQAWNSVGFRAPSALRNLRWIAAHIHASYDTSCPTVEVHSPQPGGCCSVFPFMLGDMVELPFTMPQDHTLFVILRDQSEDTWFNVASQIMAQNGLINVIVHPDYLADPAGLARYEALLRWLVQREGLWFSLPKSVAAWWSARNSQQLVWSTGGPQITGPMSERARTAYARVVDDGLLLKTDVHKPMYGGPHAPTV